MTNYWISLVARFAFPSRQVIRGRGVVVSKKNVCADQSNPPIKVHTSARSKHAYRRAREKNYATGQDSHNAAGRPLPAPGLYSFVIKSVKIRHWPVGISRLLKNSKVFNTVD